MFKRLPHSWRRQNSYGSYTPKSLWQRRKPTIVVSGFIGLCCGTFLFQVAAKMQAGMGDSNLQLWVHQNLMSSEQNLREGRWWVLLGSSFTHANVIHLGLNMLCLWSMFGKGFVSHFGPSHFVAIWVLSAVSCSAAGVYWQHTQERLRTAMAFRGWGQKQDLSVLGIPISRERALAISGGSDARHYLGGVGASGAICGLSGVLMCYMPRLPVNLLFIPGPLWGAEIIFVSGSALCMATGFAPFINHAGHISGMAAGIAYYFAVARPWLRRMGRF